MGLALCPFSFHPRFSSAVQLEFIRTSELVDAIAKFLLCYDDVDGDDNDDVVVDDENRATKRERHGDTVAMPREKTSTTTRGGHERNTGRVSSSPSFMVQSFSLIGLHQQMLRLVTLLNLLPLC